jgi:hypothetical protein
VPIDGPRQSISRGRPSRWSLSTSESAALISAVPATLLTTLRYDSNEARFLAAYPAAELGHTQLLKAVNEARVARGERISRRK